jgi:hypothetical protein
MSARSCWESLTPSIVWAVMARLEAEQKRNYSAPDIARRPAPFIVIFIDALEFTRQGALSLPGKGVLVVPERHISCGFHKYIPYYEIAYRILKNECSTGKID